LETAVGLAFDLVHQGIIDLERMVELCSTRPARIVGLEDRGTLRNNAWGDITILDPDFEWTFDVSKSRSKSRNTPFDKRRFKGAAVATIVNGRVVYLHPQFARIMNKQGHAVSTTSG
jgi:dihydroorotase